MQRRGFKRGSMGNLKARNGYLKGGLSSGLCNVSATSGMFSMDYANYSDGMSKEHSDGVYTSSEDDSSNSMSEFIAFKKRKLENGEAQVACSCKKVEQQPETETPYKFLEKLIPIMLKDGFQDAIKRENKVVDFHAPEDLKKLLPFLPIKAEGASDEELLAASKDIIKYSVKTSHPRFYNQLYGGHDEYSLGGCWLTEVLNASLYTYEVAPVFTLMEKEIYRMMLNYIGFTNGDGIFCPGGSIANLYAINVARYHHFPEIKTKGIHALGKRLCLFTSERCHYSIKKAAAVMGIGMDNVIEVKADAKGKMIPADLEAKIQHALEQGWAPFFVNATAGTTVYGAYDPIEQIADITEKYNLWLHVDGAWGGSVAISKKYRHLIKGIERADSMIWNPHKMLGVPQQCSAVLVKHKDLLLKCLSANALYLFQQDKFYDVSYDTGDMSLQCGRKVDVLKFWMMWKNKGLDKMERDVDHLFECSEYLVEKIKKTPGFRLLLEPECTNVCFWYIPPSLRDQEETPEWWSKVGKVAPVIKERMVKKGSMMIGYQPEGSKVNFFRMILSNFDDELFDMDFLVEEIVRLGEDL